LRGFLAEQRALILIASIPRPFRGKQSRTSSEMPPTPPSLIRSHALAYLCSSRRRRNRSLATSAPFRASRLSEEEPKARFAKVQIQHKAAVGTSDGHSAATRRAVPAALPLIFSIFRDATRRSALTASGLAVQTQSSASRNSLPLAPIPRSALT
jgi:hypothetical protein